MNLWRMTMRDVEEGGLRHYENKGRMNGETADVDDTFDADLPDAPPDCVVCVDAPVHCRDCQES